MKYLFINRFFYPDHSATSQMLTDLTFALANQGLEITVITSQQRYDDPGASLPKQETCKGVKIIRVATPQFGRNNLVGRLLDYLGFYISATWALLKTVDRDTLVIAKTDPPLISIPAALVCRLKGARLINWLQDLFPEVAMELGVKGMKGPIGRLLKGLRNRSLRTAHINVAIGERMQQCLIAEGVPETKIRVIENWADGQAIHPIARAANPLRKAWELQDKFVVGYSGNLGRAHETETLLGAAEELNDQNDIVFLFIGGGALRQQIEHAARSKGLKNILLKPYQPREQLSESLGVADAHIVILQPALEGLIVPSKYYGVAAAGRAVLFIGDLNGEIASTLAKHHSGSSVQIGNSRELAEQIVQMKNAELREQMGKAARQSFDAHYAMEIALEKWHQTLGDAHQ